MLTTDYRLPLETIPFLLHQIIYLQVTTTMVEGTSSGEPQRRCFVLCFDGTGNQFRGDSTDSNVLRTFRLLDRSSPSQFSWYNPGLGTYIQSGSVEESSPLSRLRSWYLRKRDLAVGANVGDHVMAGYKFLMRYVSLSR